MRYVILVESAEKGTLQSALEWNEKFCKLISNSLHSHYAGMMVLFACYYSRNICDQMHNTAFGNDKKYGEANQAGVDGFLVGN